MNGTPIEEDVIFDAAYNTNGAIHDKAPLVTSRAITLSGPICPGTEITLKALTAGERRLQVGAYTAVYDVTLRAVKGANTASAAMGAKPGVNPSRRI